MKSKLIINSKEKELVTFLDALSQTGIYKRYSDYCSGEYLIVLSTGVSPLYFGMYDDGRAWDHVDKSSSQSKEYKRLGDVDITVKLIAENNE